MSAPVRQSWQWIGPLVLVIATVSVSGNATVANAQQRRVLRLVGDRDYPPLTHLDAGDPAGLDVDIARTVADRLGLDLRIELMDWNAAQAEVREGRADGLLALSVTDERLTHYDFVRPTVVREFGLFVRRSDLVIRGIADLAHARVGVTAGGYPRAFLTGRHAGTLVLIDNYEDGFARVRAGTLDAVAADTWVAAYTLQQRHIPDIRLAGPPFATLEGGLAFGKGRGRLAADINAAIERLEADGTLGAIRKRWRPHEVVFVTRQRVTGILQLTASALVLVIGATAGAWLRTRRGDRRAHERMQAALIENQRRLQAALSAADMGTWRWIPATDMETRDASLNRMLGLQPAESTQPAREFLALIHEDDRARVRAEFERAVRDGNTCTSDFRVVRPDGAIQRLRARGKPFFTESGELSYVTGVTKDMTERMRVDERLTLLAHALESANDCITITDLQDRLLFVNRAFLRTYEYTESEIVGQPVDILRSGDTDESVLAEMSEATKKDGWRGEIWNQSKSGRVFPVSLATSMVRDEHGRAIAAVGVARDESVRHELESQLRKAQQLDAVGRLAAGVAHDFNNLLMVIMSSCEDAMLLPGVDDRVRLDFEDVYAAAEAASALTRQLLAFGGRQVLQPRVLNLNDVLASTQRILTRLIGNEIDLLVRTEPALGHTMADAVQLQQVVVNLAINARDAMPDGGRMIIQTRNVTLGFEDVRQHPQMSPGPYVVLVVSDTGAGMDKATLARIFEPFFTTKQAGKGTGLGLSTVYGIVKQCGGFIWAYSEPGLGAAFHVYLPRVEADGPGQPDSAERDGDEPGSKTPTGRVLLLIEDHVEVREMTRLYLTKEGYSVLTATTAAEALELCADASPALLITDIMMPDCNGPALAEHLRRRIPGLKVLYISGYADAPFSGRGLLSGSAHFLAKPYTLRDLADKIREILES